MSMKFTHEELLKRGFEEQPHGRYEKKIGMLHLVVPRLGFTLHVEGNPDYYCYCDTTITTLSDLDIFLSYIKHD